MLNACRKDTEIFLICDKNHFTKLNNGPKCIKIDRNVTFYQLFGIHSFGIRNNFSINMVKTHRMRIFKKLHVDTITEALAVIGNYQLV